MEYIQRFYLKNEVLFIIAALILVAIFIILLFKRMRLESTEISIFGFFKSKFIKSDNPRPIKRSQKILLIILTIIFIVTIILMATDAFNYKGTVLIRGVEYKTNLKILDLRASEDNNDFPKLTNEDVKN